MNIKKLAPLLGLVVMSLSNQCAAASNPFSDVPAGHWAYDALTELAEAGVVEGYGDGTFRGDKNITRYEMAQMVAKAMGREDLSEADRLKLEKLAAEFAAELKNLGVRVDVLERNADSVNWSGSLEYTYSSTRYGSNGKDNYNSLLLKLDGQAMINDNWSVNTELEATTYLNSDNGETEDVQNTPINGQASDDSQLAISTIWAQGDYDNFSVKLGKLDLDSPENYNDMGAMIFNTEFSGAQVDIGDRFKTSLLAGRLNSGSSASVADSNYWDKYDYKSSIQGVAFSYDDEAKFQSSLAYYHLDWGSQNIDDDELEEVLEGTDNIFDFGLDYAFDDNFYFCGAYAVNTAKDDQNKAWQMSLGYKNFDETDSGSWGAYLAYRNLGDNVSRFGDYDEIETGYKGWGVAVSYVPLENIVLTAKYGKGVDIANSDKFQQIYCGINAYF